MENFTISVPNGTTNHGNPNLICTPVQWQDTFIFFFVNYFAHAFTVKQFPGEEIYPYSIAIIAALLYPYSGLPRGIESILRRAIFYRSSELETACRAGALCVVVRSQDWTPAAEGQMSIKGVHLDNSSNRTKPLSGDSESVPLSQPHDLELGVIEILPNSFPQHVALKIGYWVFAQLKIPLPSVRPDRKIHGLVALPGGYKAAILPGNATIVANTDATTNGVKISSTYNFAQVVVSLVQLVASSITLYRSRGDQVKEYGYAAFGLTVLPYVTMSIVNFVGNLATPNYPAIYLVNSPELEEAKTRGGKFDGITGTVVEAEDDGEKMQYKTAKFHADGETNGKTDFTVTVRDSWAISTENSEAHEEEDAPPSDQIHRRFPVVLKLDANIWEATSQVLEVPACTPFKISGANNDHIGIIAYAGYGFFVIPYVVIGALTRFKEGHSTHTQQVWTMVWLVFDTLLGYWSGRPDPVDHRESGNLLWLVVLSAPAIGGLVIVGQQIKHYGSCIDVNSGS